MDRLKRQRAPVRTTITKTITEIEAELAKEQKDQRTLTTKLDKLEEKLMEAHELDLKILDAMLDVDTPEAEYNAEHVAAEEYEDKVRNVKSVVNEVLKKLEKEGSEASFDTAVGGLGNRYKLPKIEIKKFSGDFKEWLSFWSQFEKIDQDPKLHASDKFQYLVQSMVKGSKAEDLVSSYPQTADNYPKVTEALKDHFGDKTILTEIYVRELMKLVKIAGCPTCTTKSSEDKSLTTLYVKLESHFRALESLGVEMGKSAIFLYPMVESCLPVEVLKVWQRSTQSGYNDDDQEKTTEERLKALMKFLHNEVKGASRMAYVKESQGEETSQSQSKVIKTKKTLAQKESIPTIAGLHIGDKTTCIFCDKPHESRDCVLTVGMSLDEKRNRVQKSRACYLCLKPGHSAKKCRAVIKCPICERKHLPLMCPDLPAHKSKKNEGDSTKKGETETVVSNLSCSSKVILGTVVVTVKGPGGTKKVRALCDSGSQRTHILEKTALELKLDQVSEEQIIHSLFGGAQTEARTHRKFSLVAPYVKGQGSIKFNALGQEKICGSIPRVSHGPWMQELKDRKIWLSDVGGEYQQIELLIGADIYGKILTGRVQQLQNGLTAVQTSFGWTIMGKLKDDDANSLAMTVSTMHVSDSSMEDLWNLDAIGIHDPIDVLTKVEREQAVKEYFRQTVSRSADGRYEVRLPWVDKAVKPPDNRLVAEKRLDGITKRIQIQGKYKVYNEMFESWLTEKIIEEVPEAELDLDAHYLPHRPVFKANSGTTPVRPVFDGSCKSGRSPSLNECLEKGPNLLEMIPSILLRFREGRIGVVSDIRKAFLMIDVSPKDRDNLRFLWWNDVLKNEHRVFRHRRVVFGLNCSPFLLGAVIEHHLNGMEEIHQPTAQKLLKSLYVDNCVTSVETRQELEEFKNKTTKMMADAQMDLRLWQWSSGEGSEVSLSTSCWCGLESNGTESQIETTSVLGLNWDLTRDTLGCDFVDIQIPEKITKRVVLSCAQKIYDPIGFLCPALLLPKMLLQESWQLKKEWDDDLTEELGHQFKKWCEELQDLKSVTIPRNCTNFVSDRDCWQLHTFCDASQYAYGAVVFLRTELNGNVSLQLLLAKSRVAPLKRPTIPRLELLSCVIGSRLFTSVKEALTLDEEVDQHFWSDSTTALAWIRRNDEWGTFVGNRVKEICGSTEVGYWKHVPGHLNPADLPSRGCSPSKLLESNWWEGPAWLLGPKSTWPSSDPEPDEELVISERKKSAEIVMTVESKDLWYVRSSSYSTNVRILAWIRRLAQKCNKEAAVIGELSLTEIETAEKALIKIVQEEAFPHAKDIVKGIRVVRGEDGLIRVKTRILERDDTIGFRVPILLPHAHPIVEQLIREHHLKCGHSQVQFLMGYIREKFWILQGRKAIRTVVSKCVRCRRFTAKKVESAEAPLPKNRIKSAKPFEVTGVDLAGPLQLKKKEKVWIVIFTCAVYRAVHLELVSSASTEGFLDAITCFWSRRGRPQIIYSDNGTNFVGTANLFKAIDWKKVQRQCDLHQIKWIFNPPAAPWWGGWWERLIRTLKDLLKRILGKSQVPFNKLNTYLCEIESYVNGRPLTTVTEDPEDLTPLTPAMFLHELPCPTASELDFLCTGDYQEHYKNRKTILNQLKMRFRKEYLGLLVQRGKEKKYAQLKVGDIVFIGAENKKRWEWPMARVLELVPGKDGIERVAHVKTANGILTRPIQRLYPLEVSSNTEEDVIMKEAAKELPAPVIKRTKSGRHVKTPEKLTY